MHEEMMKKPDLGDICEVEKALTCALKTVVSQGIFSKEVDYKELGELVDMVKDMAETKKDCWKAYYYMTAALGMEGGYDEEEEPMGYNANRYSSGRFAPAGKGHRSSGYMMPKEDRLEHEFWMDGMRPMGYSGNRYPYYANNMQGDNRYGKTYAEYENARRHYTETKSPEDKSHMDESARGHIKESMETMREIWKSADPTLRKEMKASLTGLISEMPT